VTSQLQLVVIIIIIIIYRPYIRLRKKRHGKDKGKAIPVQGWTGPEGSRTLTFKDFKTIGTWRWYGCQPYAPAAFIPQEVFLLFISVRSRDDPKAIVCSKRLCQCKMPITPSGIEPATFRFVAQCLNHNKRHVRKYMSFTEYKRKDGFQNQMILSQGYGHFANNLYNPPQNSTGQKTDMKQIPS